jgi:hypothetical protein
LQVVVQILTDFPFSLIETAQATALFQQKYSHIFPNKNILQLKIREVRQKLMASPVPLSA